MEKYYNPIWTVSQLNQKIQQLLTTEMGAVWLSGEISNFAQPASGHGYFTLKDERAQVRCVLFNLRQRQEVVQPKNGIQVLVQARITLYVPRGEYQLIVEQLYAQGDGVLQQRFELHKRQLAQEGLFNVQHKQQLPHHLRKIGLITSITGAVLHDMLQILKRRHPTLGIVIYPTAVQGNEATLQIINALELANKRCECDVLILARGGGTLEDLWCFNEVAVARAIFASTLPVISAIGHETDVTIADFVADLRAPTPSAAAELVSHDQQSILQQLEQLQQQLTLAIDHYLSVMTHRCDRVSHLLHQHHPQLCLTRQQMALLHYTQRLYTAWTQQQQQLVRLQQRLWKMNPTTRLPYAQRWLQQQFHRLQKTLQSQLHRNQQQLATQCARLEVLSPLSTLSRGFSITYHSDGTLVYDASKLLPGQKVHTRLHIGWFESHVSACNTSTT